MAKRRKKNRAKRPAKTREFIPFGRAKYATDEDFKIAVEDYFLSLGKRDAPNKSGLCLFINLSRETLNQYKKRYPDTIKYAEEKIKTWWVTRLSKSSPIGAIFYLKNFDGEEFSDRIPGDSKNPFKGEMQITGMKISKEK